MIFEDAKKLFEKRKEEELKILEQDKKLSESL